MLNRLTFLLASNTVRVKKYVLFYTKTSVVIGGTAGIFFSSRDLHRFYKKKLNKCNDLIIIGLLNSVILIYSPFYFGRAIVIGTLRFFLHPIKFTHDISKNYHNYQICNNFDNY